MSKQRFRLSSQPPRPPRPPKPLSGSRAATSEVCRSRDLVIAGTGYTGRRLAPRLSAHGHVTAIARSTNAFASLPQSIEQRRVDLGTGAAAIRRGATVIYLAPPPAVGDRDTTLERFLDGCAALERIVYASTSGVYGDCDGELVDETRTPAPKTARALRRTAAEATLRDWCAVHDTQLVILRIAGIYGPGRLPLARLQRREPVLRHRDAGPGNRIHVEDLVSACLQAAVVQTPPQIVNVSDGDHLSSTGFTQLVAGIAGLPAPPQITLAEARERFTEVRWSFLAESRRLDNRRMLDELGVRLRYADPADGVRAALARQ